jgi:hypothetical protein
VRALKIGRDIDSINADERAFEVDFPPNDSAQLTFHEFVYA